MSNKCHICGNNTIFYVWTTSRNFPREKLYEKLNIKSARTKGFYEKSGYPVCFGCYKNLCEE